MNRELRGFIDINQICRLPDCNGSKGALQC
jgi:hypothetical protein